MKKKLLALLLIVCFLLSLCGCSLLNTRNGEKETDTLNYCYNNLTAVEQSIYKEMLVLAKEYKTSFEIYNATGEECVAAYIALVYDHPELFWLSDGYEYITYEHFGFIPNLDLYTIEFNALCLDVAEGIETYQKEFSEKVDEIVKEASKQATNYEKALFVHDYIVNNTVYDKEIADIITSTEELTTVYNAQTAYGCLVEGKAVCSGYAEAFQLIMKELGFVCGNVIGETVEDAQLHQWNFLQLDGEYYIVDTTWDDVEQDSRFPNYRNYEYFLANQDIISASHKADESFEYPQCSSDLYYYYSYNGYADTGSFDYETSASVIKKQLGKSQIAIFYSSADECKKAQEYLLDKQKIFDVSNKLNNIWYFEGNTGRVLFIIEN